MAGLGDEVLPGWAGQQHDLGHPGVVRVRRVVLPPAVRQRVNQLLVHHLGENKCLKTTVCPEPRTQNSEALERLKQTHGRPWMLTIKAWTLKMEPLRVYRPAVADSHHFDEE
jgi:hypothetical protein